VNLEQAIEAEDADADLGEHLMLDYELSLAAAELAWLDSTLVRSSQSSLSVETAEDGERSFVTLIA
jgi:hypothetical protein